MGRSYCFYNCLTCNDGVKYDDKAEFSKHLVDKHGYKVGTPGTRRFAAHMDGSGWHETWYEWEGDSFKFREVNGWNIKEAKICSVCGKPGGYLCDFVLPSGKTCDKPLCGKCRVAKGADLDWCPSHQPELKVQTGG
jgi:hypothetical protein